MLAVERLGKKFDGRWIFRGVDFELQHGQALIVLGRNGAGKSTFLKTLAGVISPTEGTVRRPDDLPTQLGFCALDGALYPALSIEEHLVMAAQLRGVDARTDELLERICLEDARTRPCGKLSTGMRNRVKLALAIQARPEVLLLDEPGAAMDEAGKELVSSICAEQAERGVLVIATNDPSEVRFGTHEIVL